MTWGALVAAAEGIVAVLVAALVYNVIRLRDRITRLEALEDSRERDEAHP